MYETSEQERRTKNSDPDEIDLVAVFKSIGRFFKGIANSFKYLLGAILNNFLVLAIIFSLGVALGFGAYKATKPYYTSSMTMMLSDIRNEFVEDQLAILTEMVEEENYEVVAKYLDIKVDDAKQIKKMEFTNLDQDRIAEDSILVGSPFRIEVMLYDNNIFETMEPAVVNYLESNRYFSKQKRIRQRQMENLIGKYKSEISSIDSIKTSVSSPRGPVNGFVYGEPLDPTSLYQESVSMYQRQVNLEAELDRLDNIEIVNGFTPRLNPTGPNLLKFLFIGGAIAFVFGVIAVLILENKKRHKMSM